MARDTKVGKKLSKTCTIYSIFTIFFALLLGFLLLNLLCQFIVVMMRYFIEPPGVNCATILAQNDMSEL